jgi:hypothetical protein
MVPSLDWEKFKKSEKAAFFPEKIFEYLIPMPNISNRSLVWIMKNSSFGLCYDQVIEAFGFYPIESVYCGSPIFTNGPGNVRHLLPRDHGIVRNENIDMYFGPEQARVKAYESTAHAIYDSVTKSIGKKQCINGKKYIRLHYHPGQFTKNLRLCFSKIKTKRKRKFKTQLHISKSPYLRIADWEKGRFVTDGNIFQNEGMGLVWKALLEKKSISIIEFDQKIFNFDILQARF